MIQGSYIKFHQTSGYSTASPEIKRVYDGFEIYNFNDMTNPRRPVEDSDYKPTTLQLLAISYHYAPTFFDTKKQQKHSNGQKNKYSNTSTFYRRPKSWSSTLYYLRKRSACGYNLGNYHRRTWTTGQTRSTHGTISIKKYTTPSTTTSTSTPTTFPTTTDNQHNN
eukprot:6462909-Amphidinium_carterae.2